MGDGSLECKINRQSGVESSDASVISDCHGEEEAGTEGETLSY